jgi:SAM-dependent methyltransferase
LGSLSGRDPVCAQYRFYETAEHEHLQVRNEDHYARKLAARLAEGAGIEPHHRVLEVGAGFGRFTFPLLPHCGELVALDLSPRVLDSLARSRAARGIPPERCRTHVANLDDPEAALPEGPFDVVVGFFLLHHLPDFAHSIRRLTGVLTPGGRMAFVEPNRRNPLFLAQVAACPDMTWREEKGMFTLSARGVESGFGRARLGVLPTQRFGFFPPQVVNRLPRARRLEERLESLRALEWLLPFLLLRAEAPESPR